MEIKITNNRSIFYDEVRHHYTDNKGKYIPSVSGIASSFNEGNKLKQLTNWAVDKDIDYIENHLDQMNFDELLNKARTYHEVYTQERADIGIETHKWIENFIKGKQCQFPKDDNVISAIQGFMNWVDKVKPKFIESEIRVYSTALNVAGTLDGIAKIGDKKYLIDFKTGKSIYKAHKVQLAGYKICYEEMYKKKIDYMLLLHLDTSTGKFKAVEVPFKDVEKIFTYLVIVNKWFDK